MPIIKIENKSGLAWVHNVRPLRNSSLQEWMLCSPHLVMVGIPFNNSHFVQFYHREYVLDFGAFMIFENLVNFNQLDLLSAFFFFLFSFSECKFKCISLSRLCNSRPCSHLQVCLPFSDLFLLPLIAFLNVDTISHCLTYKERAH